MKLFGYIASKPRKKPLELEEVTLVATPATIRRFASFLEESASKMERSGSKFEHVHLLDAWSAWDTNYPDFIVARSDDAA